MSKYDNSIPLPNSILYFEEDFFEFWVFDFVVSGELFDNQFGIGTELYLRCTKLNSASNTEKGCRVLGNIICRYSDVFESFFHQFPMFIGKKNPTSCRAWIATRTTICISYNFHRKNRKRKKEEEKK